MQRYPIDLAHIRRETFVRSVTQHAEIASTNDWAKAQDHPGADALPWLILAERQTAGRGRGTNRWWSDAGSLTFSLVVQPASCPGEARGTGLAGLAAAVAVVRAVRPLLPDVPVGVHWPNDVFAAGRKLSGVLVEVLADRRHVVGVGLNTNNRFATAPDEVRGRAVSLVELTGQACDPTVVLRDWLQHFAPLWQQLGCDPAQVAREADALGLQHGRWLTVRQGTREQSGRCVGIGANGALILDTLQGRVEIVSGILV